MRVMYLLNASLTVRILRSLRMSSFLTYHGAFTIVRRILACIVSILFIWLIAAVSHSGISYVQLSYKMSRIWVYVFECRNLLFYDLYEITYSLQIKHPIYIFTYFSCLLFCKLIFA